MKDVLGALWHLTTAVFSLVWMTIAGLVVAAVALTLFAIAASPLGILLWAWYFE